MTEENFDTLLATAQSNLALKVTIGRDRKEWQHDDYTNNTKSNTYFSSTLIRPKTCDICLIAIHRLNPFVQRVSEYVPVCVYRTKSCRLMCRGTNWERRSRMGPSWCKGTTEQQANFDDSNETKLTRTMHESSSLLRCCNYDYYARRMQDHHRHQEFVWNQFA